jgi:hypothetical protein
MEYSCFIKDLLPTKYVVSVTVFIQHFSLEIMFRGEIPCFQLEFSLLRCFICGNFVFACHLYGRTILR